MSNNKDQNCSEIKSDSIVELLDVFKENGKHNIKSNENNSENTDNFLSSFDRLKTNNSHQITRLPEINIFNEIKRLRKWFILGFLTLIPCFVFLGLDICILLEDVCIKIWFLFLCVTIISLPSCIIFTKTCVKILQRTRLLHNNHVYYMIKLHDEVAQLLSCIFILCFWRYWIIYSLKNHIIIYWILIVSKILSCVLTLIILRLIKNFIILELSQLFLWKPYINRIKNSIFSQYIFLLFTDYIAKGCITNTDQLTALEFSELNENLKDISIYALSRAISYVPTQKLQNVLNEQSPDNININLNTPLNIFGEQLFELLSKLLYKHQKTTNKVKFFTSRLSISGDLEFEPAKSSNDNLANINNYAENNNTLHFASFEQILMTPLVKQIMILFNSKTSISKKIFCNTFVRINKERKSLLLSIKDYENIILKLGHIFSGLMYIILFFISLYIFNINIQKLTVTWLSLFLGISFMFSSTCSSFIESVTFIFITHNYDIGDRITFINDGQSINCLVTKINLLNTVFKTWDNKWLTIPNQVLSKKLIYNDRRSNNSFVKLDFSVSPDTTIKHIDIIQEKLRQWASLEKTLTIISDSIELYFRDLINPHVLSIAIVYEQTTNFQDNSQFWKNKDCFTKELTKLSVEYNLLLKLPSQQIILNNIEQI